MCVRLLLPICACLCLFVSVQVFLVSQGPPWEEGVTKPWRVDEESAHNRRAPSCLIIGARKGGTRALLDALAIHPAIRAARREIHYFDREFDRGREWYVDQMPLSYDNQITIEKTPAYLTNSSVPRRVYDFDPRMRIIVIVREPVERTISDFTQVYYNKLELNKTLPEFSRVAFTESGGLDVSYKPVRNSLYSRHLEPWLALFPRRQIHFVDGDKFAKTPIKELRLVERFLSLPSLISPDQLIFDDNKGFYCFKRWKDQPARCLGSSKGRPHRPLSSAVVDRLRKLLRPHNLEFFRQINRVFDW